MKKYIAMAMVCLSSMALFAQEDLLSQVDDNENNQNVTASFKALKIVNLESTKLLGKKEFDLIIAHRFGSVKDGFKGFFGLDNAITQIKFAYGITKGFTVTAARSEQAYDFTGKYTIISQRSNGFPFAIVGFHSFGFNNLLSKSNIPGLETSDRLIFANQLLVSRKFNENFSFELAPTFFHENYVYNVDQSNSQFALGMGGRYKISKRVSINADYAAHLNRASNSIYKNPLSLGVDIDTGGHIFQMHFTNSQGIHEVGYLGNTIGDWGKGNIFFGFNLIRAF